MCPLLRRLRREVRRRRPHRLHHRRSAGGGGNGADAEVGVRRGGRAGRLHLPGMHLRPNAIESAAHPARAHAPISNSVELSMKRILVSLLVLACFSCAHEERDASGNAIEFKVYPGARSLPELTELFKKASAVSNPGH